MAIVTQIGSLPYDSVEKAVEYSLRHDIPFLPELPKLGESMHEYIQKPGALSCLPEFKKHSYDTVKVQCIGPATMPYLEFEDEKGLTWQYSEGEIMLQICTHLAAILDGLNAKEIMVFLDEPMLGQSGINYESKWEEIFFYLNEKGIRFLKGVHFCERTDFDRLFRADIDIISFDASYCDIIGDKDKYLDFRQKGGRIAWGIKNADDITDFYKGDLITMPCGLGGMNTATGKPFTADECEQNLEMMMKAAEKYR